MNAINHCGDNGEAINFLGTWDRYAGLVKDAVDNNEWDYESILGCLYAACKVYSHPFYRRNSIQLIIPSTLSANSYRSEYGREMVDAVVLVAGGYESLRKFSSNEQ